MVKLLQHSKLYITAGAVRTCWQSQDKSDTEIDKDGNPYWLSDDDEKSSGCGPKDCELIDRVGNKFKHGSVLEHLSYTFYIKCSRAVLQELSRSRIASPSVKSSRYTLKELKDCESFELPYKAYHENGTTNLDIEAARANADKYLVWTGDDDVDRYSIYALENLRKLIVKGVSNDKAKYALPDSMRTEITWSINARSLQNVLRLRSDKSALWEYRILALDLFEAIPDDHKFIFKDCISEESFIEINELKESRKDLGKDPKKLSKNEERCKHCSMLSEKDNKMFCDEIGKFCDEIDECSFLEGENI